jgi:hypothetical protein
MDEATLELNGDDYGSGSGSGSGDGYGDGYGDGDGYGSGGGSKVYFQALLAPYSQGAGVIAFWRSRLDGTPANGGVGDPVKVGDVQEVAGPLRLCGARALHATFNPQKWKGERWWIVELAHPVESDTDKLGSLRRRIVADLGRCPF